MASIIRCVPSWVWLLMAGLSAAATGWLHLQAVTAERDTALTDLRAARVEKAALVATLEWRRQQAERKDAALAERERTLDAGNDEITAAREVLPQLERDDAETAKWSAAPVPDGVAAWVRNLQGGASAGKPDARATEPSD